MLQNRLRVVGGESFVRPISHTDSTDVYVAAEDHNDVCAQGLNLLLYLLTGALADRHCADNRSDADDDSKHGQDRPQLVAPSARYG